MSDVGETVHGTIGKKMGPLPVWGWGLIVGAVIVGVMWYRGRAGSSTVDPTAGTGAATDPNAMDDAALFSGNDANAANASFAAASTANPLRTNRAWLRAGVQYETGRGRNALVVMRALSRYMQGLPLNEKQAAIVSEVLKNVGVPPKPPRKVSPVRHKSTDKTPPATVPHKRIVGASPKRDMEITPRQALTSSPSSSTRQKVRVSTNV